MFGKKLACPRCKGKVKESFDFCPHCGCDVRNPEKDLRDFGMLGKNEVNGFPVVGGGGMGISDKVLNSLFNQLMKALESQMRQSDGHVETLPNGIKIQLGVPVQKQKKVARRTITPDQVSRMTGLPRVEAKTDVRRLSDKVLYELKAPGIESVDDVFVSKVESGYEVKAIGKKKVYVNNLPVNLPLKGYSINEEGLVVEFGLQ